MSERTARMPLGVVVTKRPGVTRWAAWSWRPTALLPGAEPAHWRELRREAGPRGEAIAFHAATVTLELHRAETEAYRTALADDPPRIWVVLRPDPEAEPEPMRVHLATASPFEGQDYLDSGEEIVEALPAPPGLVAWIREFVERHHVDEAFVKRARDRKRVDLAQDGIGDPRIRQDADVYRAPGALKPRRKNGAGSEDAT